jgi:hypothetical protein
MRNFSPLTILIELCNLKHSCTCSILFVWNIEDLFFYISPFLFASCTNASTFSKWCDGRRRRERGAHLHPSVIRGAKPGVEIGNRNVYKLTN